MHLKWHLHLKNEVLCCCTLPASKLSAHFIADLAFSIWIVFQLTQISTHCFVSVPIQPIHPIFTSQSFSTFWITQQFYHFDFLLCLLSASSYHWASWIPLVGFLSLIDNSLAISLEHQQSFKTLTGLCLTFEGLLQLHQSSMMHMWTQV